MGVMGITADLEAMGPGRAQKNTIRMVKCSKTMNASEPDV